MHRNDEYNEYPHCMLRRLEHYTSSDLQHVMMLWRSRRHMLEAVSLLTSLTTCAKIRAEGSSADNIRGKLQPSSSRATTVPCLPSKNKLCLHSNNMNAHPSFTSPIKHSQIVSKRTHSRKRHVVLNYRVLTYKPSSRLSRNTKDHCWR